MSAGIMMAAGFDFRTFSCRRLAYYHLVRRRPDFRRIRHEMETAKPSGLIYIPADLIRFPLHKLVRAQRAQDMVAKL